MQSSFSLFEGVSRLALFGRKTFLGAALIGQVLSVGLSPIVMAGDATREFLDGHQYTGNGIERYEQIFGRDFVSTGGLHTTQELVAQLGLKPDEKVLDVGAGIGGSAFHMAKHYGAKVTGIDLSHNMISRAKHRARAQGLNMELIEGDIMVADFAPNSFDVIYSRDTLLHISSKPELFEKFRSWLKPGGRVMITDYAIGDAPQTDEFKSYLKDRQYQLVTVEEYGRLLEDAGFEQVRAENRTDLFVDVLTRELVEFKGKKKAFVSRFSAHDYQDLVVGWEAKLVRCAEGLQNWGLFQAVNPK